MDTALYFPYVRVPQTPWFTQVLLYWDRAASIVPYSLRDQEGALDPYMHELAGEGLLEYVEPDSELWQRSEAFDRGFLELLDLRPPPWASCASPGCILASCPGACSRNSAVVA